MADLELKRCPFCGGKAVTLDYTAYWIVSCDGYACPVRPITRNCATPEEAGAQWNDRPLDSAKGTK